MSRFNIFAVASIVALITISCNREPGSKKERKFETPEIPALLCDPGQRTNYLVSHYWDRFDFTDTAYIHLPDVTEQAFSNFLSLLPNISTETAGKALSAMMSRAEANKAMYIHFADMAEKYLYDLNSPFHEEEQYSIVLEHLIASPQLTAPYKVRPAYQLEMIQKNRPGSVAADFTYTTPQGEKMKLSETRGEYILLFFYNPDCHVCSETKEYIHKQGIAEKVEIVWANPEKEKQIDEEKLYDLRVIPTLYLLDKDKRVLLKDAPIVSIHEYLQKKS